MRTIAFLCAFFGLASHCEGQIEGKVWQIKSIVLSYGTKTETVFDADKNSTELSQIKLFNVMYFSNNTFQATNVLGKVTTGTWEKTGPETIIIDGDTLEFVQSSANSISYKGRFKGLDPSGNLVDLYTTTNLFHADPLPVRLTKFAVSRDESSNVVLSWETESEMNFDRFEVEHSFNARVYTKVGEVKSLLSDQQSKKYSFLHNTKNLFGIQYYRLKKVDLDGSFAYSTLKSVDLGEANVQIYPNPATEKVNILVANYKSLKSADLFDASGRRLFHSGQKKPSYLIDVKSFPQGVYLLHLTYESTTLVHKVLISR